jgi:glycosyltransferase involved in cell wall biosynthesis
MLQTLQRREQIVATPTGIAWHIITCEYPPQSGGVSDYTYLLAQGMASRGDEVHVWCPAGPGKSPEIGGVEVHADLGKFSAKDLRAAGRQLDRFPHPRRLLVQWVPHGFGYKSLNLPFCLWLWHRSAKHGDRVELMVHEPYLPFLKGHWRQNAAAVVHRLMTLVLLRTADRVWVSTPAWEERLRPYEWGRHHTFNWLPVPSNVPTVNDAAGAAAIRRQYAASGLLVGHFGTFGPPIVPMLRAILPPLLRRANNASLLLIGVGSSAFRESLARECPDLANRIHATGKIEAGDRLSLHLSACDLLVQPFPDGVTSRRSTIMAALSHGRPTITTEGALTEPFWRKSGAVTLAPAGASEAFVELAIRFLENPEARASLGEAGRDFYRREFDIEHVVGLLRRPE